MQMEETPDDSETVKFTPEKRDVSTIIDNCPVGIIVIDTEEKITYVNERAQKILGGTLGEIRNRYYNDSNIGRKDIQELFFPAERFPFRRVRETLQPVFGAKHTIYDPSGEPVILSINAVPLFDGKKQFNGIVATIDDVAEKFSPDNNLNRNLAGSQESERFLSDVFKSIQNDISVLDVELNVIQVNPKIEEWYAYNQPLVGKKCYEAFYCREEPCDVCPTKKTINTGQTDYEIVQKTGSGGDAIGWLELYSYPLFDSYTGNLKGVIEYARDVTTRLQVQHALIESERKYRTLFENSLNAVAFSDLNGIIYEANHAFFEMSGYPPADLPFIKTPDLYANVEDRTALYAELMQNRKLVYKEVKVKRKDGSEFWIALSSHLVQLNSEERVIFTAADITKKKETEAVLQSLYEEQLHISEMKTNLITFASHELKTPLTPILGWIEYIRNAIARGKDLNEVVGKTEIESLYQSAKRLEQTISNFLDVSRFERGEIYLEKSDQSIIKLMDNAIENVHNLIQARNTKVINEMQDINLPVDAFRIEEIFINILSNAIKYSPDNAAVWIKSEETADDFSIFIQDEGLGFTLEELRDAWRPFSRSYLSKQASESLPGTGVGLYLAKVFTELHGGKIEIQSDGRDCGSTVMIMLPKYYNEFGEESQIFM